MFYFYLGHFGASRKTIKFGQVALLEKGDELTINTSANDGMIQLTPYQMTFLDLSK